MPSCDDPLMRSEMFKFVLPRLKRFARVWLSRGCGGHSLQSMKLVNKLYTVLVPSKARHWRGRARFSAIDGRALLWRKWLRDRMEANARI